MSPLQLRCATNYSFMDSFFSACKLEQHTISMWTDSETKRITVMAWACNILKERKERKEEKMGAKEKEMKERREKEEKKIRGHRKGEKDKANERKVRRKKK